MKTLTLELKKKILIMEIPDNTEAYYKKEITYTISDQQSEFSLLPKGEYRLICKGSELKEEIAKDLVNQSLHTGLFAHYVKDIPVNTYCYRSSLISFISAIEAHGYYWGKNPYQHDWDELCEWGHGDFSKDGKSSFELYHEAREKTFNPKKTLIFEIFKNENK